MSSQLSSLALGVCAFPAAMHVHRTVEYPEYIHEMLGHAGLCYRPVEFEKLDEALDGIRILVTIGERVFDEALHERLTRWVRDGGAWISIGGVCGMSDLLGAVSEPDAYKSWGASCGSYGEGYLDARECTHPILADLPLPLHFFNGIAVKASDADIVARVLDAHHRPTKRPALIESVVGDGYCLLLTPDITGAVVRIQQGMAVTRDGVPAPDGTGTVTDGVLKSGDGKVLDWLLDREPVPGAPGLSAFLQPIADQWRDVALRAIFHAAVRQRVTLPLLWFYPRGVTALGHISLDSDGNDPVLAQSTLDALRDADLRTTWCVLLPVPWFDNDLARGYEPAVIDAIRSGGHELATHYDAVYFPFSEKEFDRQWHLLSELFGGERPTTNKNHYLRWEGDVEFFEWCVARGIRLDQSKGTSKTGEVGFNFGTSHPYRPISFDGRVLDIHELPTLSMDLILFAPEEIVPPLMDAVLTHYGIFHFVSHPQFFPTTTEALIRCVRKGRERGIEWWTGREIVQWEEARRTATWAVSEQGGVSLTAGADLPGATLLALVPDGSSLCVTGTLGEGAPMRQNRWGFSFQVATGHIAAGETVCIDTVGAGGKRS